MPLPVDNIVRVTVTRSSRSLSRRSFASVMIVAYHDAFIERARTYTDPSEMLDDGFTVADAAYKAAVSLCAQTPRVPDFKVGRREGAPVQSIRLTPSTPVAGEVYTFTLGGVVFTVTADSSPSAAEIITAFLAQMTADVDAIQTDGATTATLQTLDSDDFDGVIGGDEISPPRNVTFSIDAHADWDATTIVVTGIDENGRTITESFTVPDGGDVVLTGTRVFAQVTQVAVPAQGGAGGTYTMGVGTLFANADLDITGTDGSTYLGIANDDTGAWFAYTDVSSNLSIEDVTAEPATTLAADLTAIRNADADFYGLVVADAQSEAQIVAAAAWAETQPILYVAHAWDTACELDVETDVLSVLRDAGYLRTKGFYNRRSHGLYPDAAMLGRILAIFDAGPITPDFEFKALAGILADDLSTDAMQVLVGTTEAPLSGKNATVYVELRATGTNRGESITYGGLVAGGEWADVIMGLDFSTIDVQDAVIQPRLNMPRVPFTEEGADILEGAVRGSLLKIARRPYQIADEASIVVEHTPVAGISAAQKQTRHYDGVTYDYTLTGSIRGLRVRGTVRP